MKPRLLVVELWGLGDLVIATPFLQAASRRYQVTLLAKPYAEDLRPRFWPKIEVRAFVAPWTAFRKKYVLWNWPWGKLWRLRELISPPYDIGLSARWDPRDHILLRLLHVRRRIGFPRLHSQVFLTDPLTRPDPLSHRYENWRVIGERLGLELPPRESLPPMTPANPRHPVGVLVHTGAGQPVRVWPLERYRALVARLRAAGYLVQVLCDSDQREWWVRAGIQDVLAPRSVTELMRIIDEAGAFLGNDSGPSHLAAACGVPTFTIFGPQLPEWFAPLHPSGVCLEGKPCPYKPCSDYCRFPEPWCMVNASEDEVSAHVMAFLHRILGPPRISA